MKSAVWWIHKAGKRFRVFNTSRHLRELSKELAEFSEFNCDVIIWMSLSPLKGKSECQTSNVCAEKWNSDQIGWCGWFSRWFIKTSWRARMFNFNAWFDLSKTSTHCKLLKVKDGDGHWLSRNHAAMHNGPVKDLWSFHRFITCLAWKKICEASQSDNSQKQNALIHRTPRSVDVVSSYAVFSRHKRSLRSLASRQQKSSWTQELFTTLRTHALIRSQTIIWLIY